jgi:thiol:disulfide interchange protein DsbD
MLKRHPHLMLKAALILCVTVVAAVGHAQFFESPIRPSITVSQTSVPAGGTFEIVADFPLDEGIHLYKDKLSFRWTSLLGAQHLRDVLPEGKKVPDDFGSDKSRTIEVYEGSLRAVAQMQSTGKEGDTISIVGELSYQGCSETLCFPPATRSFNFTLTTAAPSPDIAQPEEAQKSTAPSPSPSLDNTEIGQMEKPLPSAPPAVAVKERPKEPPAAKKRSAFWLILMAFGAGIGISLTPCVYPMIPITAAVIAGTKQKGKLGALFSSCLYVLGLSITYALIGLLVSSGGVRVRTWLASPYVLVPIAGIFVLLALSMFEVISVQVQPKSIMKLQSTLSSKGRLFAVFALGMISGLVAGPCISAPLAGILVIVAKQANKFLGFFMLFSLAWGMGIILIVAGTFTGSLPKAGEWTLWVKKLLGFVMLWAAAYFLASAIGETIYHLAVAVILVAGAVYLGGFDALTRESGFADRAKRLIGLLAVFGAAYLLLGVFVKSDFTAPVTGSGGADRSPTGDAPVLGKQVFVEAAYEDVGRAIASGRPVVLDFYADWCKICKKLDAQTFSDSRVITELERFETLKVDYDAQPQLLKKYNVLLPPTIVLIGSDGKELDDLSFPGFKSPEEFLEILKKVR